MKSLFLAVMLVAGVAQAQYLVPGNGNGGNNNGNNNQNCAGQNKEKKKNCNNNNNNNQGGQNHEQPNNNGGHHQPGNNGGHHGNQGPQQGNGGYLVPGNGNSNTHNPGPSYPSNPYQPSYPSYPSQPYPSQPYYGSDYGQAYTYSWQDMGVNKVDKVVGETIRLYAGNRLVNEVLLRSTEADTQVIRAYARLSSGRILNLQTGVIREGQDVRLRLDYNYSVRVDTIEIQATSQNIFGSRARLQIWLGLAD